MSRGPEEALQRARAHLRQAALEGLEAGRDLLEAAVQTGGRTEAADASWLGDWLRNLEDLIAELRRDGSLRLPSVLADPLAAAVDAEIERWEQRSRTDPDARLVLRAFLGLRELLWELGMRPATDRRGEPAPSTPARPNPERPRRNRVQRFKLED